MSLGGSALLLSSLLATVAASSVLAASAVFTVTGAGNVATYGTSGAVSIAVTEPAVNGWSSGTNTFKFAITDSAGSGDPTIDWSGTPVISGAPGSLTGISASISLDILTVSFTGSNQAQVENFTVSGMTITTTNAATGPVNVIVGGTWGTTGTGVAGSATVPSGTGTASATLTGNQAAGMLSVPYTLNAGSFAFEVTGGGANQGGNLLFGDGTGEARPITVAGNPLTISPATSAFHADGTALTQSVSVVGLITGAATVVATVYTNAEVPPITTLLPGEQNQRISAGFELGEPTAGTLLVGTVITFKIDTAGVLFSAPPKLEVNGGLKVNGSNTLGTLCPLSFDRTSCSVTVTATSTYSDSFEALELEENTYSFDVASSVPLGTKVSINVTTSQAGLPVVQNPNGSGTNQVAVVARIVVGVAAAPTIFINYNDQATGMITLTESGAGFFTAGAGNNYFGLCLISGESFTRAPWAVVTVGDLKIRNGVVGAASAQGTLFTTPWPGPYYSCVEWIVYTGSTVASTIEIRGSDASNVVLASGPLNGPRLSVPASLTPGPDAINILIGGQTNVGNDTAITSKVSNAIRAYKSDVIVAAVSQPTIPAGSVSALAGNLTISETLNGQFKPSEVICVAIEPRSSNFYNQDTYFNTASTNMLPVISTNGASGLIVGAVTPNQGWPNCRDSAGHTYTDGRAVFSFPIVQQAFAPNTGVITISNININVNADAPNGAVITHVFKDTSSCGTGPILFLCSSNPGVDFGAFVSNAKIGTPTPFTFNITGTALGNTLTGPFTPNTKISTGGYITWRFDGGAAAAGKTIQIWAYKKTGLATNPWSAPYLLTTRVADANGIAYANIVSHSVIWLSIRPILPATATAPAIWGPWSIGRWIH